MSSIKNSLTYNENSNILSWTIWDQNPWFTPLSEITSTLSFCMGVQRAGTNQWWHWTDFTRVQQLTSQRHSWPLFSMDKTWKFVDRETLFSRRWKWLGVVETSVTNNSSFHQYRGTKTVTKATWMVLSFTPRTIHGW